MTKNNTPQLRFSEFTDEWQKGKICDFGFFYYGKGAPKTSISDNGKTPCVRYGELYSTYKEKITKIKSKTTVDPKNLKISKGKELLIPRVGEEPLDFSMCSYLPFSNVAIGEMISVYNTKENGLFLSYYFNNDRQIKKEFARVVEGGNVSNLYFRYLEKIKIYIPSKEEQNKITNFAISIDERIERLEKKKDLFTKYKKSIMQKIFPSSRHSELDSESHNPELRFKKPDGSNYPDWEEKKLGEMFKNIGGTALEKYVDKDARYKFISIGNYSTDGKYIDNYQRIILNKKTNTKILEKNNLVMVLNDKTISGDLIGSTILIDKNNAYIYNQRSERLICKKEITPFFAWYLLNSKLLRRKIFSLSQGATQIYVNFSSIQKIKIMLPVLEEQQKIADFLTSLDNKIDQINNKLTQAKLFKKSLLQKMFV